MTLTEFLNAPIPMSVLIGWFLIWAVQLIADWYRCYRYSKKCGYDCAECLAWHCNGKYCWWKKNKNSR